MNIKTIENLTKQDGEFVTRRLEKWAEEIPNNTFFFYGEENRSISFREFNRLTNSIAHNLLAMGLSKGDRVLVYLKNPLVTTLSMFGIWKAGAVFIPVNPSYLGRPLSYQVNDTGAKLMITERDLVTFINEIRNDIDSLSVAIYSPKENEHDYNPQTAGIELDGKFPRISFDEMLTGETSNLNTSLTFNDTANIIYTSGTTGPAKGVVQSHRYVNLYTAFWRRLCNQEDVVYSDLPLYHIGGAFQNVVRAAWVGCSLAVWDRFSPKDFWNRINACGATTAILLDVMITWLLNAKETPDDRMNSLNKVYMQPMPLHHNMVARRFGFDFVITGYGQTEAGNGFARVFDELEEGEGTPPELYKGYSREEIRRICDELEAPLIPGKKDLGKGFMGMPPFYLQAAILNEVDEECPPGQAGEICFRSFLPYTIFDEYFGKPDATVKAFRNHWFHSGDAGYRDEEGFFYFLDRMSGRIRRRGENISSYQIEDVINSHPGVNCCAAFPIPAEEGDEDDIVVCIVPESGEKLDENGLRKYIEGKLPRFMYPQHIKFVSDLPRTPTTKVEKYKLREAVLKEMAR